VVFTSGRKSCCEEEELERIKLGAIICRNWETVLFRLGIGWLSRSTYKRELNNGDRRPLR
jgi:GH24 family phage-related lysozyme (muramidase)